eukprot:PhM_4_TR5605/c0_g1_i1/m.58719
MFRGRGRGGTRSSSPSVSGRGGRATTAPAAAGAVVPGAPGASSAVPAARPTGGILFPTYNVSESLFPPRKLPEPVKLTTPQRSLVDKYLALEGQYLHSPWRHATSTLTMDPTTREMLSSSLSELSKSRGESALNRARERKRARRTATDVLERLDDTAGSTGLKRVKVRGGDGPGGDGDSSEAAESSLDFDDDFMEKVDDDDDGESEEDAGDYEDYF